ncbi:hypothetical protein AVEN_3875-1, partial [Araneus ventricosus]
WWLSFGECRRGDEVGPLGADCSLKRDAHQEDPSGLLRSDEFAWRKVIVKHRPKWKGYKIEWPKAAPAIFVAWSGRDLPVP